MNLFAGARLGSYEILSLIGRGGMGEVWRAHDGKLNRDVAIKILLSALISDSEYMARFKRESQVLASLNHPNIAQPYGLEESGGAPALVMELVDGETLQERIRRGPIPVEEATRIARQICDALEAAHAKGIVHRDLKPGNIKLTAEGQVKVLDFGLAKAMLAEQASGEDSPTRTLESTRVGAIVGTAGYMSPEQARGEPTDRRSDIWSFGVILWEMLTGKALFSSPTLVDTLASVLKSNPAFDGLPQDTPPSILRLLRRCLERDRKRRLHDIADARLELEAEDESLPPQPPRSARFQWVPWAVAGVGLLGAGAAIMLPRAASVPAVSPVQFRLTPPEGTRFGGNGHQVSPDGHQILVRTARLDDGKFQLWLRSLDAPSYRLLPGGEEARPWTVYSPDGRSLLFQVKERLLRYDFATGVSSTVAIVDASVRGWTTNEQGVTLLGSNRAPVQRVSSSATSLVPVTKLNLSEGETGHGFPSFLPGGRFFLYTSFSPGKGMITVSDLEGKEPPKKLVEIRGGAALFAAGAAPEQSLILYRAADSLLAVGFDATRQIVTSEPILVTENLAMGNAGSLPVWVSLPARVLLRNERRVPDEQLDLQILDRKGKKLAMLSSAGEALWNHVEFSPDAKRLLGDRLGLQGSGRDLWTLDLARNVASRLTIDPGNEGPAAFSPDGRLVFYYGNSASGGAGIFVTASDGSRKPELVRKGSFHHLQPSPDGKYVAAEVGQPESPVQIGLVSLEHPDKMDILLGGEFQKSWPQFSPNGKWLAYASTESANGELYVQSHPPGAGRWQISRSGGLMSAPE